MKIAVDHQIFGPQIYGGISRYFTKLAQGLLDLQQEVEIFAPLYQNTYLPTLPAKMVHGRHIQGYPYKTARLFSAYNYLVSRYNISRWQPDIVHETYYSRWKIAPRGCPTVVTIYDMIEELFPNQFNRSNQTIAIKKIVLDRANRVICISQNTKNDLMRLYGTPEDKISVVLLSFDQFLSKEYTKECFPNNIKPFLFYVGARSGYKNFTGFLKAVASSSRLSKDFNIVAFGGGKFLANELEIIRTLGFSELQVQQVGGNDSLLGSYYTAAHAFINPSLYEGFGITPLEAMAHDCPVISSNTSSMPEVIGEAGEYFDPSNIDDIRWAIENVVYSETRIDELIGLGEKKLCKFSWAKTSEETLDVYQSLL
jgi:glycosyltransferase involved in cell wall biosynthesis